MTAKELLRAIKRLPNDEREWLVTQLAGVPKRAASDEDRQKAVNDLLRLSGCVDVGSFRLPLPDREWLYGDQV